MDEFGEPTTRALKKCTEWLTWCLDNGWPKTALDDLQKLWWKYHDRYGNLIADTTPPSFDQAGK